VGEDKFQKLSPVRVFEQAVEQIRGLILSGEFEPGEKLPSEIELSKLLDVSRSSVREALRVLEAEGLIEVRRGAGVFVASHPFQNTIRVEYVHWLAKRKESLIQLLQVRQSLEGLTSRLAASLADEHVIKQLGENVSVQTSIVESFEADSQSSINELARLDQEFHLMISKASGNEIAHEIISHIFPAYNQSNKAVIYIGELQSKMVNEHKRIFNALQLRDPDQAERNMCAHLERIISELPRIENDIKEGS
jgi:GntR family transcriptional repressor for pyruvate dehydrogenase complex